jgi:hypothetical protein
MSPTLRLFAFVTLLLVTPGCFEHFVAEDYGQFLENNEGEHDFAPTGVRAEFSLSERTQAQRFEFRSWLAGYGHKWIVDFGSMLRTSLESADVQAAFLGLDELDEGGDAAGTRIEFDLTHYDFVDSRAHITLDVTVSRGGRPTFQKTYEAAGIVQGSKVFWAGAFGMKNAVHRSTKTALDEILDTFLADLNGTATDTASS